MGRKATGIKIDRKDIRAYLDHRDTLRIANKLGMDRKYVSAVLCGYRNTNPAVVKEAELLAAINIWKTKYCKYKSEL